MKKLFILLALVAGLSNTAQGKGHSFFEGRATGLTQATIATAVGASVATTLLQKEFRNNRRDGLGVTQSFRAAWDSLSKAQKIALVATSIVMTGLAADGGVAAWNQGDTYVVGSAKSLYDFVTREKEDEFDVAPTVAVEEDEGDRSRSKKKTRRIPLSMGWKVACGKVYFSADYEQNLAYQHIAQEVAQEAAALGMVKLPSSMGVLDRLRATLEKKYDMSGVRMSYGFADRVNELLPERKKQRAE